MPGCGRYGAPVTRQPEDSLRTSSTGCRRAIAFDLFAARSTTDDLQYTRNAERLLRKPRSPAILTFHRSIRWWWIRVGSTQVAALRGGPRSMRFPTDTVRSSRSRPAPNKHESYHFANLHRPLQLEIIAEMSSRCRRLIDLAGGTLRWQGGRGRSGALRLPIPIIARRKIACGRVASSVAVWGRAQSRILRDSIPPAHPERQSPGHDRIPDVVGYFPRGTIPTRKPLAHGRRFMSRSRVFSRLGPAFRSRLCPASS